MSTAPTAPGPSDGYRQWLRDLIASSTVSVNDLQSGCNKAQPLSEPLDFSRIKRITTLGRSKKFTEFDTELDEVVARAAADGFCTLQLEVWNCEMWVVGPWRKFYRLWSFMAWMQAHDGGVKTLLRAHLEGKGFASVGGHGSKYSLSWSVPSSKNLTTLLLLSPRAIPLSPPAYQRSLSLCSMGSSLASAGSSPRSSLGGSLDTILHCQVTALFQASRRSLRDLPGPVRRRLHDFCGDALGDAFLNMGRFMALTCAGRQRKLAAFDVELASAVAAAAASGWSILQLEACKDSMWVIWPDETYLELKAFLPWMHNPDDRVPLLWDHLKTRGFNSPGLNGNMYSLAWS